MDFTVWLTQWLSRHPLKTATPNEAARARLTDEVMRRIQAAPAAVPARGPVWQAWRLPQFALAGAVAAALAAVVLMPRQSGPSVEERAAILAAVNDPTSDVLAAVDHEALAEEWQAHDLLVFAEAGGGDEQWLEQTLDLLQQLDEDVSSEGEATDDEWLEDLKLLDESELSARS